MDVSFAHGHWGQHHPEILLCPPTLLSPLPPTSCSTHLNGLGGLLSRVVHQRFLGLKVGRVSHRGRTRLPKYIGGGCIHSQRTRPILTFCPVSSSCRNWFQDSSVQTLSAFSLRLGTYMEVGRHQLDRGALGPWAGFQATAPPL